MIQNEFRKYQIVLIFIFSRYLSYQKKRKENDHEISNFIIQKSC